MAQAPYLFPAGSRMGVDNLVLHARATHHRVENFAGPPSLKTVVSGQVAWIIQGRKLLVDPASFLVVSAGEKYSMNIAAQKPVETCCLFWAMGFIEQIAQEMISPLDRSFEIPITSPPALPYLAALHTDVERNTVKRVQDMARRCTLTLAPSGFEEEFLVLTAELLHVYQHIRDQVNRVPAARNSTREELFRRLLIGREYFHSHGFGPVSLTDAARAACISPFHFHRGFTHAFGETPHSYLTNLRLARAHGMLQSGASVLEACLAVGFSSPSGFSHLFRARFGTLPSFAKRRLARSSKNAH